MMQKYLDSKYKSQGRDLPYLDCHGLARLVRSEIYGRPLLPSYVHIESEDKRGMTKATITAVKALKPCGMIEGALVTAWRGRLCLHVAVVVKVDGRLWMLETDKTTDAQLVSYDNFVKRFQRVEFYD